MACNIVTSISLLLNSNARLILARHRYDLAPSGAVIFLAVFGQPVATRRRTRLEGVLAVLGEIRGGGPVWDAESGGTVCVLVADCQWPQSRTCLKPETMRLTFEEFSPTHDFFDNRGCIIFTLGAEGCLKKATLEPFSAECRDTHVLAHSEKFSFPSGYSCHARIGLKHDSLEGALLRPSPANRVFGNHRTEFRRLEAPRRRANAPKGSVDGLRISQASSRFRPEQVYSVESLFELNCRGRV
jgi:hypothetical protein